MPAALTYPIGSRFYDWKYESEPEPHMNGRRIYHARGKVLGGSSSINGMIFQRGNPLDYERWSADPGMQTWDYAHCLPYFRRMEHCLAAGPGDGFRGAAGPLILERGPATNPLFGAFFEAVQQAGHPLTDDVNGYRQEGFAPFDRNVHRGRRLSAARAYLHRAVRARAGNAALEADAGAPDLEPETSVRGVAALLPLLRRPAMWHRVAAFVVMTTAVRARLALDRGRTRGWGHDATSRGGPRPS